MSLRMLNAKWQIIIVLAALTPVFPQPSTLRMHTYDQFDAGTGEFGRETLGRR